MNRTPMPNKNKARKGKPAAQPDDSGGELAALKRQVSGLVSSGDCLARIVANPSGFSVQDRIEALADWQIDRVTFNHRSHG